MILEYYDKMIGNAEPPQADIEETDIRSNRETIPVGKDRNLKQTPRDKFFSVLEDFHRSPKPEVRMQAIQILKDNPVMFGPQADPELTNHIFRWRDLLVNNDPELVNFLYDLWAILPGQNQETIKRFFSIWMDVNMEHFIAAYSRSKDNLCSIAGYFGETIPEEEKLNEYYDREDALKAIIQKEGVNPLHKALATNCLTNLGIEISKIAPGDSAPAESAPATGTTP